MHGLCTLTAMTGPVLYAAETDLSGDETCDKGLYSSFVKDPTCRISSDEVSTVGLASVEDFSMSMPPPSTEEGLAVPNRRM